MKLKHVISKNSHTLLSVISIASGAAAVVLSAKAAIKAHEIVEEKRYELNKDIKHDEPEVDILPKEKTIIIFKTFWPVITLEVISVATAIGSNKIRNQRLAAMSMVAASATSTLKDYARKVTETVGEKKEREIRDSIAQDEVKNDTKDTINVVNVRQEGDMLCKDACTGRYFWSTPEKIQNAINLLNKDILDDTYAPWNSLYDYLGIENIDYEFGEVLGFNSDRLPEMYFSSCLTGDNRPVLVMKYRVYPMYDYDKLYFSDLH